jgi:phosphatidate cytidylyltransferase
MLRMRVLTALALTLLVIVAILYSPPAVTAPILGLILLIGAWEWSAFLTLGPPWPVGITRWIPIASA